MSYARSNCFYMKKAQRGEMYIVEECVYREEYVYSRAGVEISSRLLSFLSPLPRGLLLLTLPLWALYSLSQSIFRG